MYDIEYRRQYANENRERLNAIEKKYYYANREKILAKAKKFYQENKDKKKIRDREYYKNNTNKIKKKNAVYRSQNREKVRECQRVKGIKRRAKDPIYKLHKNMSRVINHLIKINKNRRKTEDLLGYSILTLKTHIEKQFKDGMTWGNYGRHGWHIDHIIPISVFNFKTSNDIDFKRCWSLKNLRPLWAKENLIKSNKLDKPFQPAFLL